VIKKRSLVRWSLAIRRQDSSRPVSRQVGSQRLRGSAAIEWLAAAPIIMLLGLAVLQWGLVFFGRSSVEYALIQAAREGAQGNALISSVESGMARGLIAYWGLSKSGQPLDLALPSALLRLNSEKAKGALVWRQISPTEESFTDWAVPARDALGDEIASVVEIPNDGLQFRKQSVGASSGQTLKDANLLKLEMRYGIALNVPLIGPLAVRIMEQINNCPNASSADISLGTIRIKAASSAEKASGSAWPCAFYRAKDANGADQLRWPVQSIAMVRMQTPARKTGVTASRKESPLVLAAGGPSSNGNPGDPTSSAGGETIQGIGSAGTTGGALSGGGGSVGGASTGGPSRESSTTPSDRSETTGAPSGPPSGTQSPGQPGGTTGVTTGGSTDGQASGQSGGQTSGETSPEQNLLSRIEQEGKTKALEACRSPSAPTLSNPG
jgi:TadE-like protein